MRALLDKRNEKFRLSTEPGFKGGIVLYGVGRTHMDMHIGPIEYLHGSYSLTSRYLLMGSISKLGRIGVEYEVEYENVFGIIENNFSHFANHPGIHFIRDNFTAYGKEYEVRVPVLEVFTETQCETILNNRDQVVLDMFVEIAFNKFVNLIDNIYNDIENGYSEVGSKTSEGSGQLDDN